MDGIVEIAKMFKDRDNTEYDGYVIGDVISDFPDIKIKIDNGIILDNTHLVFSAHLIKGYTREIEIVDSNNQKIIGKLKMKDTIVKGDKVILFPSKNSQSYVVTDKAVTFDVS